MTTLLSFDGGNEKGNGNACYVAHFDAGRLQQAWPINLEEARAWLRVGFEVHAVAVEMPDYLKVGVPPKVIFGLAWNVCRVAYTVAQGAPVHEYTVNNGLETDWIGGTNKAALHLRIWRALEASERRCFPANTTAELDRCAEHYARKRKIIKHASFNTLDAAGVGLFHLGRIKKGGVRV